MNSEADHSQGINAGDSFSQNMADLVVDYIFNRPIGKIVQYKQFVNSQRLSILVAEELKKSVRKPETEEKISVQVRSFLDQGEDWSGPLRNYIPSDLIESFKELLSRDYTADREFVRAVVDHPTMRIIIRDVMKNTLTEFADRVRQWMPQPDSLPWGQGFFEFFLRMFGMARKFTKQYSQKMEERIETQAEQFVDEMIDQTINEIIIQLTSNELSDDLRVWRIDLVDAFMDLSVQKYRNEILKIDPEKSIENMGNLLRTLTESEDFEAYVQFLLELLLEISAQQTLSGMFDNFNLAESTQSWVREKMKNELEQILNQDEITTILEKRRSQVDQ